MKATIKYKLSSAGQKASLLSGGDGRQVQAVELGREDPAFAAAVELGTVGGDGSVSLDLHCWGGLPEQDLPRTAEELVALERGRREAERDAKDAKNAKAKADTEAVLRGRLVAKLTHSNYVSRDGVTESYSYEALHPDWPLPLDPATAESPAAMVWLAELEAVNRAAKARAEAAALERLAPRAEAARQAAEAERLAREERARLRAARCVELGGREDDLFLAAEQGALVAVPPGCWESHNRGKNWLAKISPDPSSPGGLGRDFAAKAKGDAYYMAPALAPGDAVEFGADYYSGRGRKSPTRWYGFVVASAPDGLVLRRCATGKAACKAGEKFAAESPSVAVAKA